MFFKFNPKSTVVCDESTDESVKDIYALIYYKFMFSNNVAIEKNINNV